MLQMSALRAAVMIETKSPDRADTLITIAKLRSKHISF
jgi:hypothetical protein